MEKDNILTPEKLSEDIEINTDNTNTDNIRPKNLDDFVGQTKVKENLKVFINASKVHKETMDHTLFFGPPGLGKTTLSNIISTELGVGFKVTSGPVISKSGDLVAILTNLQEKDVLFIDEIHRLSSAVEEILYSAMEDFKLDLLIGEGPSARSVRIDLPRFTLVAATTRAGLLTKPLRERFGITLHMEYYSNDELTSIILRGSKLLGLNITFKGAYEIARRSRGTPRVSGRLLRRVRDFSTIAKHKLICKVEANEALLKLDIDNLGLDKIDRNYMMLLAKNYNGGPVGIDTLSVSLASEKDILEDVVEPFLIQQGLLQRTSRGRSLTTEGWRYIGLKPRDEKIDNLF